jgi:tight adherence protein B
VIVRSLKAGHPVPVAVSMVAREMPDPIGTEFGLVSDEITYGSDLETAMRSLQFRVGHSDLHLFVTAIAIQSSTGGNLREILGNLSRVIRERIKMRRKVKSVSSEGRSAAMILSSLPILFFALIQVMVPNFYGELWNEPVIHIGLVGAAIWMMIGIAVMAKMINFKI